MNASSGGELKALTTIPSHNPAFQTDERNRSEPAKGCLVKILPRRIILGSNLLFSREIAMETAGSLEANRPKESEPEETEGARVRGARGLVDVNELVKRLETDWESNSSEKKEDSEIGRIETHVEVSELTFDSLFHFGPSRRTRALSVVNPIRGDLSGKMDVEKTRVIGPEEK